MIIIQMMRCKNDGAESAKKLLGLESTCSKNLLLAMQ